MKTIAIGLILAGILSFLILDPCFGHGGQYRGPGDGGGPPNSSKGSSSAVSINPGSGSSASGPTFGQPTGSSGGATAGKRGGGSGGLGRKRAGGYQGIDRWEFWWEYNKDSYLKLKNKIFSGTSVIGGSSFLVGRGQKDQFRTSNIATEQIVKSRVLPSLINSIQIDHPDIQDSSVLAIARVTRPQDAHLVMDTIREMLASTHQSAQQSACLSLGVLGSKSSIPLLKNLMFNTNEGKKLVGKHEVPRLVSAFAAISLGLIGAEESVEDLIKIVENEEHTIQKDLVSCAITALGLMGVTNKNEEIAEYLCKKLEDPRMDPAVKSNIPIALGKLYTPSSLDKIVSAFSKDKQNEWIRQSCAIAIGQIATPEKNQEAVKHLIEYIRHGKDMMTKHLCFISLGQIGSKGASLMKTHKVISKFLLSEIEKPSIHSNTPWAALGAAINAMPHLEIQTDVIDVIASKFKDTKDPSCKSALAISLGLLNADNHGKEIFKTLTSTRDKILQGYLCVGLGLMRYTEAAETIREYAANEPGFFLRLQAAVSLGLMEDSHALPVLVEALKKGDTLNLTSSAARALGQIGDASAIDPLTKLLIDKKSNDLARAFAIVALGMIGEKTILPWNTAISENCNYGACTTALNEVLDIL